MGILKRAGMAAALACVGLGVGEARAQYFGPNPIQYRIVSWRTVESKNFTVHFHTGHDSVAHTVLQLAERAHASLSSRLGITFEDRVPIVVHASRNGALQTNVRSQTREIGTGNFGRGLRNRMTVTFTGSYDGLRRAVIHELVHALLFDRFGSGGPAAWIGFRESQPMPPWFVEGLAEYLALGFDAEAAMVVRDGAIDSQLPPLKSGAGYLTYKLGQSAVAWLVEQHGEASLREVVARTAKTGEFEPAFRQGVGKSVGEFERLWRQSLRKQYWPVVARTESPEQFARRLTDFRRDEIGLKNSPAISPQGDRVAYYSSRRQFTDVRLISSFDGKVLRRLTRMQRIREFEFVPSLRGGIAWSPDGERIAMAGASGDRDVLEIRSPRNGKILARRPLPCESPAYPAWSPDGDSIAVTGTLAGRSDIWLIPVQGGTPRRLTDDAWDEKDLTWSPVGRRLTFASDRVAPVVVEPERRPGGFGRYAIFTVDLASGVIESTVDTGGDDYAPAWSPNGRRLAFVSLVDGTPNIHIYDVDSRRRLQLTRVRGGIQGLSWAHGNDRLVFSAYDHGAFDLFALREELSRDDVIEKLHSRSTADSAVSSKPSPAMPADTSVGTRADAVADLAYDTGTDGEFPSLDESPAWADRVNANAPSSDSISMSSRGLADSMTVDGSASESPDSISTSRPNVSDSTRVDRPPLEPMPMPASKRYRSRLRPEVFGGGVQAAENFGFIGDIQLTLTDILSERLLYTAVDLVNESATDVNALVAYRSLRRRWDVGLGAFHFGRFLTSRVTTMAEQLDAPRLYSERVYGGFLSFHYPFDRFHRLELLPTVMFVERDPVVDGTTGATSNQNERRSVFSPVVSIVRDDALLGFYGPVSGSRLNLTYGPSYSLLEDPLEYQTVTLDSRHYQALSRGWTFAMRLQAGASGGRDAQTFRMGGYGSLRGYPEFELLGSRMAIGSAEMRFPFVQDLGILGPVSIGGLRAGGAVFTDLGFVWDRDEPVRVTAVEGGTRSLKDLKLGFGVGARTAFLFAILKVDLAWATDFDSASRGRWHISLGPEF